MEPPARFERAAFSLPRRRSDRWSTKQARAGEARFGRAPRGFKDLQAASYPIPHWSRLPDLNGSPSGYRPDVLPDELRRRGVPGAIRTRTADLLGIVTPAVWSTRTRSRHPVSNRASGLTRAGPQAVRGGEAGHPGFEPGNSGSRARRICQFSQWPSSRRGGSRTRN
jgi:hypothetical protein